MSDLQRKLAREHLERRRRINRAALANMFKRYEHDRPMVPVARKAPVEVVSPEHARAQAVIKLVAEATGVPATTLLGERDRRREQKGGSIARHLAVYLVRELVPLDAVSCENFFGRNGSNIRRSVQAVERAIADNSNVKQTVEQITQRYQEVRNSHNQNGTFWRRVA